MLNILRYAGSNGSLEWFAMLAGPLLCEARKIFVYHSVTAFDRFLFCVFFMRVPQVTGK
jgi:hypothetical protein